MKTWFKIQTINHMKKIIILLVAFAIGFNLNSCQKSYDPGDWSELPEYPTLDDEYKGHAKTLKVMSINMNLASTAANFPKMVEVIKAYNPDLLFLRQCDSKTTRANSIDRPQVIADELDMNVYMKGRSYQNGLFGNAVLSKFPIKETFGLDLTKGTGGEQRMLAMIKIEIEEGVEIYFAGTELETIADDRRPQIIDILREIQEITDPLILVGNFNEQQVSPGDALNYLAGDFLFACPTTGCAFNSPKATLTQTTDYITFKDPAGKIIISKNQEPFKVPESPNNFFPSVAELKIKLPQ